MAEDAVTTMRRTAAMSAADMETAAVTVSMTTDMAVATADTGMATTVRAAAAITNIERLKRSSRPPE